MSAVADAASSRSTEGSASRGTRVATALIVVAFFAVYWASSYALVARKGTTHFGGDPWFYAEIAKGNVLGRLGEYQISRIFRFHMTTVLLGAGWMETLAPLTRWIPAGFLLKALFAAVGALGVLGAIQAFAMFMPRRQALLWGIIYGSTLGVWYFSSIEESKIVTATLATLYIATYARLRAEWTPKRALLLSAILLVACFNDIVVACLVAIPALDALVQRGIDLRHDGWIILHAALAPVVFVIVELVVNRMLVSPAEHPEGASHFSMLIYYVTRNDYSLESVRMFLVRWLFFNLAAPERSAAYWAQPEVNYGGDFLPTLASYLTSPLSTVLAITAAGLAVALVLPRWRGAIVPGLGGFLLGLAGYAAVRMIVFYVANPWECLLFASTVTLPHLLLIAVPFAASRIPAKEAILVIVAALLIASNGRFIVG